MCRYKSGIGQYYEAVKSSYKVQRKAIYIQMKAFKLILNSYMATNVLKKNIDVVFRSQYLKIFIVFFYNCIKN